jgi:predicted metal-dependent HD superfamily phosphohydrolase
MDIVLHFPSMDSLANLGLPTPLVELIERAYAAPGRAYHDRRHLDEVLDGYHLVAREVGWKQPREILIALLFHDAVYLPGRHDNESESARLARESAARWLSHETLDPARVEALILLTARHGSLRPGDLDAEAALFVDVDMSILGADQARFDAYDRGVASEYAALPREVYRAGRRAFLERLLAAERIFLSDYFHERLDARARANLRRALDSTA